MKYSVHFETLGCRLNQIESESAARCFSDSGFLVDMDAVSAASVPNDSVVACIVNTCTVTTKAEQKARRIIRLLLQKFPQSCIIVTGCYAQLAQGQIAAIDERVAVLPGQQKDRLADIPQKLHEALNAFDPFAFTKSLQSGLFTISNVKPSIIEKPFRLSTDSFLSHSRASIKIQDGCNNVCTYCAIHLARGHSVSLDVQEVINRVLDLQKAGYQEVVFTTVNIGQYRGLWQGQYVPFAVLLRVLLEQTEGIRFRLSSLYPEIVTKELAELIRDERVQPHFHISLQSGSDAILQAMKRPYKAQQVYDAVDLLKSVKNDPFLACDIIAGFPGETDADFDLTMKLARYCGFTWIHAFPFSPRPGTEAYKMKPVVPQSVAGERVAALVSLACENKIAYIKRYAGRTITAVAESVHNPLIFASDTSMIAAVTENFLHCKVQCDGGLMPQAGSRISLQIDSPNEDAIRKGEEYEAFAHLV